MSTNVMSAFRGSQNALRVLNFARKSHFAQSFCGEQGNLCSRLSTLSLCRYSTVKVKETDTEEQQHHPPQKEPSAVDPFGLGGVVESESSSVLVQGFYPKEEKPLASELPEAKSAFPSRSQDVDPHKQNRLSKYDDWLRQREEAVNAEKSPFGEAESLRETHFGQIRVDSDNPIRSRGRRTDNQFDKGFRFGRDDVHQKFRGERRKLNESRQEVSSEPIIERIEADHSRRMRAKDFMDQMEQKYSKAGESSEGSKEEERAIEKVIWPKNRNARMDPDDPRNYESAKANPIVLDSGVVPREFKLPEYNKLTEEDMWSILRQTVIFQNDFLFAINKPPGVPVHSKTRDCHHTIVKFFKRFADLTECKQVYPLHRIDKETTGVLLFAKDAKVASILRGKFAKREVSKKYLAVTKLCPRIREGTINIPIGEGKIPGTDKYRRVLRPNLLEYGINPSKKPCFEGITKYRVLHSIEEAAFVEIEPVTGYKHQIRVHFGMGLGCPVIGDHKYSHRDRLAPQRLPPFVCHRLKIKQSKIREMPLHLHCNSISFTLPEEFTNSTEPVYIHAKIPFYMKYTLKRLGLIR